MMTFNVANVDSAFVDVHFPSQPKYVFGDTGPKPLAAGLYATFEDTMSLYPASQWPELAKAQEADGGGAERLVTRIFDQGQEGSCVGNGTTAAVEVIEAKQVGKRGVTQLSPISLYKRIGSSPGSGANVSDALDEIKRRGILPLDTPENRARYGDCVMPATGYYTKFPANWEATASKFNAVGATIIQSVEGIFTALFNELPVVVGRDGHCICYLRIVYVNGQPFALYVNSWGQWGMAAGDFRYGFGLDSMSTIRRAAGWAFALNSIRVTT